MAHPRPPYVVNSVSGDSFGIPTTYLPGREIQFGVRYLWSVRSNAPASLAAAVPPSAGPGLPAPPA